MSIRVARQNKITLDEMEIQRQLISEAKVILEPLLIDECVDEVTKKRLLFCLDATTPTYYLDAKPIDPLVVDRLGSMFGCWPFTSAKYPWPKSLDGEPLPPFLQIELEKLSVILGKKLGNGLLQIWANHIQNEIRVISKKDCSETPSTCYFDTGILCVGEKNKKFDALKYELCPHIRRNYLVTGFGNPLPTVLPNFEPGHECSLEKNNLSVKYEKIINKAAAKVSRYFPENFAGAYLFGAHQFIQDGYGSYIDMCYLKNWRPLMCFHSDERHFEFGFDGQGYLLYRENDGDTEFFFFWDR
jgi:hypothetical protein